MITFQQIQPWANCSQARVILNGQATPYTVVKADRFYTIYWKNHELPASYATQSKDELKETLKEIAGRNCKPRPYSRYYVPA
jgi:hypothetical protein